MIDERITGLMHAGLDGELAEPEIAELELALKNSSEARDYQSALQEFVNLLDSASTLDLPAGVHRQIVDQIKLPPPARAGFRLANLPGFVRYGFAAAAGLLLTIGLYEYRPGGWGKQDLESVVGTIIHRASDEVTLDTFAFELDELSSIVRLQQRDGSLVLDVFMDSTDPVEITVDFTSDGLQFDAIAQMESDLNSIEFAGQAIRVKGRGRQHFAVLLHRESNHADSDEVSIKLQFSSNGKIVKEGALVAR